MSDIWTLFFALHSPRRREGSVHDDAPGVFAGRDHRRIPTRHDQLILRASRFDRRFPDQRRDS